MLLRPDRLSFFGFVRRYAYAFIAAFVIHIAAFALPNYHVLVALWQSPGQALSLEGLQAVLSEPAPSAASGDEALPSARQYAEQRDTAGSPEIIQSAVVDETLVAAHIERLRAEKSAEAAKRASELKKIEDAQEALIEQSAALEAERVAQARELAAIQEEVVKFEAMRDAELANLAKQRDEAREAEAKLEETVLLQAELQSEITKLQEESAETEERRKEQLALALEEQKRLEKQRQREQLLLQQAERTRIEMEDRARDQAEALAQLQADKAKSEASYQELQARQLEQIRDQYIKSVQQAVRSNWRNPPSINNEWSCDVVVAQNETGMIENVATTNCSAGVNEAFVASVERAVYRSEPLPLPVDQRVFERNLRFIFVP